LITILVLASSPLDLAQLHLGKETKLIKHTLDSAINRDQYRVISCTAATVDDLRRYILEYSPTIVHFCGHGGGEAGLCMENSEGGTHLVSGASLAKLFHLVSEDVKCLLLNACYSDEQARPISEHIDFVIGMRDSVDDESALKFAQGFYEAIWAGRPIAKAFKFGCSAIDTAGLPDEQVPILLTSPRLGSLALPYGERVQELENFILRYVNSPIEARTELTVEGPSIASLMHEYYAGSIFEQCSAATVVKMDCLSDDVVGVTTQLRYGTGSFEHVYYVKFTTCGLRMNWKATVGYCEVPLRTLLALSSHKPVVVRVRASLDDYFNWGLSPENFVSVQLRDLEKEHVAGFISRHHSQIGELLEFLRDGREHLVTLEIQPGYPGQSIAEITKFLSRTWVYDSV
jgi:hypothetical protein